MLAGELVTQCETCRRDSQQVCWRCCRHFFAVVSLRYHRDHRDPNVDEVRGKVRRTFCLLRQALTDSEGQHLQGYVTLVMQLDNTHAGCPCRLRESDEKWHVLRWDAPGF